MVVFSNLIVLFFLLLSLGLDNLCVMVKFSVIHNIKIHLFHFHNVVVINVKPDENSMVSVLVLSFVVVTAQ